MVITLCDKLNDLCQPSMVSVDGVILMPAHKFLKFFFYLLTSFFNNEIYKIDFKTSTQLEIKI